MHEYLAHNDVIDFQHHSIQSTAVHLAHYSKSNIATAAACFHFVRDEIKHCIDYAKSEITCSASEVMLHRTGYCYAKSHLLAALLRANDIPAGFCYQRLSVNGNGPPFCLHGLNAVFLDNYGWYRLDARGNSTAVNAEFTPPIEQLAFSINDALEFDYERIFPEPLPKVLTFLQRFNTVEESQHQLPDAPLQ